MPAKWPPTVRQEAVDALVAGESAGDVAQRLGVPVGTVKSWGNRYQPSAPTPQPNRPAAARRPPPAPARDLGEYDLADATRGEYLSDRIRLIERCIRAILDDERTTWSAVKPILELQAKLQAEYYELVRAEGTRLDLSADPRHLASAIDGMGHLLRVLSEDLDSPDTIDLSGLEDILGDDVEGEL